MFSALKEKGQQFMQQNEINQKYSLPELNTASGGHELLWKIYNGKDKRTGAEVSVWVFELSELSKIAKENRDKLKDIMHREIHTLKLLRHPYVLKIVEVFEDNRKMMAFATERVICSLANANKNYQNIGDVPQELRNLNLSEFEVTSGLMQVAEGLAFLHKDARRVHSNICPESIFLTPKGTWKIGGFGFTQQVDMGQSIKCEWFQETHSQSIQRPIYSTEPNLCYVAPEMTMLPKTFGSSADIFSLGLISFEFLRGPSTGGQTQPVLDVRDGNPLTHQYKASTLHPLSIPPAIPPLFHNTLRSCLQVGSADRCDARGYLQSPFFDSGPIQTMRQLQSLIELDAGRQAQYLSTLPPLLDPFPPRILRDMVLPALVSLTTNAALTPFLLPAMFKVIEKVNKDDFNSQIAPYVGPLLMITEPPQTMLLFTQNLKILLEKAEKSFIRDNVVPMLIRALDSNIVEIQDMVLKQFTLVADLFEYHVLKNNIQPRVQNLILQTTILSVRVNALICMAKIHHLFDKTALIEGLLPTLSRILQVDSTPAVCMCVVGCYDAVAKTLGPEYMAKMIVPAMVPLLWERKLNGQQFDIVLAKTQSMILDITRERERQLSDASAVAGHTEKLEQATGINLSLQSSQAGLQTGSGGVDMFAPKIGASSSPATSRPATYREEDFYGQQKKASSSPVDLRDNDDPFYLKRGPEFTEKDKQEADRSDKPKKWKTKKKTGSKTSSEPVDLLGMSATTSNPSSMGSPLDAGGMFSNLSLSQPPPVINPVMSNTGMSLGATTSSMAPPSNLNSRGSTSSATSGSLGIGSTFGGPGSLSSGNNAMGFGMGQTSTSGMGMSSASTTNNSMFSGMNISPAGPPSTATSISQPLGFSMSSGTGLGAPSSSIGVSGLGVSSAAPLSMGYAPSGFGMSSQSGFPPAQTQQQFGIQQAPLFPNSQPTGGLYGQFGLQQQQQLYPQNNAYNNQVKKGDFSAFDGL